MDYDDVGDACGDDGGAGSDYCSIATIYLTLASLLIILLLTRCCYR